jgi:hypothetical protein
MARNVKVVINKRAVLRDVMTSNKRSLALQIRKSLAPEIPKKQKQLQSDFESHPVTREIEQGPYANNISGLTNGYGNLFSFIGFEANSTPTIDIKRIFDRKITYSVRSLKQNGSFKVSMSIPTLEEVFSATPIPWAGGLSWAEGIEKGISNLGSYVYSSNTKTSSRSGSGLQVSKSTGSSFDTTPYISKIIEDFKNNLRKI